MNANTTLIHNDAAPITNEEWVAQQALYQALLADGWASEDAAHGAYRCDGVEDAVYYLETFLGLARGREVAPRALADAAAGVPDGLEAVFEGVEPGTTGAYTAQVAVGQSYADPSRGGAVVPSSDGATGYVMSWRDMGDRLMVWGCSCTDALRHGGGCKHEAAAREAVQAAVNTAVEGGGGVARHRVTIRPMRRGKMNRR
jgi:hypothetical protein